MKHTDFGRMPCPIARSLGKVGEWWSILILRDAFYGLSRFDEFEKSLKIAPNMLTRRLAGLVAIAYVWLDAYCHACMYNVTCSVGLEHWLQKARST